MPNFQLEKESLPDPKFRGELQLMPCWREIYRLILRRLRLTLRR